MFAQNDSLKNYSFGMNYMASKILIHTPKITVNAPPFSQAIELNFNKQTLGNADWQQRFGFPETGLSICLASHGSKELGYALGLYPSIQFRLIQFKNNFWYLKIGGGIGINSKHWHRTPYTDSNANIIGSTLNNFTMLQTGYRFKIHKNYTLQTGIDFYHVSNASARKPNYGINSYGVHIGLNYHPKGAVQHFHKKIFDKTYNPLHVGFQSAFSFSEDKTVDGPLYMNYNFTTYVSKMYRGKSRAMLGIEGTYNAKLYSLFKNTYQYVGKERQHAWQYAVFAAHEFVFGKIGLPLQLGVYLNRENGGQPIYQKLGLSYHFYHVKNEEQGNHFVKDIYLTTQLKTHFATADFAEFGFGILF